MLAQRLPLQQAQPPSLSVVAGRFQLVFSSAFSPQVLPSASAFFSSSSSESWFFWSCVFYAYSFLCGDETCEIKNIFALRCGRTSLLKLMSS